MTDDRKGTESGDDGAVDAPAAADQDREEPEEEEADAPRITLDRYLSKRRTKSGATWSSLVVMFLMLVTLVLLIIYKDKCGEAVSSMMGDFEAQPGENERPPVKIKLGPVQE